MAIYKKGADPVALRASAERITGHARECETVKGEASRAVHALKGQWGGADLDHLMNRWPPVEAQLTQFGTDLGKLAEALRRNAGAQDTTSGQGGSGSGPAGAGGNGAGNGNGGSNGIPGYDLLKSLWTPIKGLGTAVGLLGTSMKVRNFLSNLGSWDSATGVFANLKNAWKTGRLAEFGEALAPKNWGTLSRFLPSLAEGGALTRTLGTVGKALGPIGVAFGGFTVANDISEGNYGRAGYDSVMTGLGAAALMTPPPVDVVCGIAAGGMAVGQLVYDNWDTITDFTSNAADAVGDFTSDAVDAVGDFASGAADTLGDVADAAWPF
ncbi:hypothetical protein GCM10022399_32300 [Terrabacter ginsenosidimutans]|uniref:WXG100 family type VII secretion target n=1 Tax=Terrabacter ginsenosidimutans TaxID=490575 RepID=A0ABP7E3X2_9MICO